MSSTEHNLDMSLSKTAGGNPQSPSMSQELKMNAKLLAEKSGAPGGKGDAQNPLGAGLDSTKSSPSRSRPHLQNLAMGTGLYGLGNSPETGGNAKSLNEFTAVGHIKS